MGLTSRREELLKAMPQIESKYAKSKDGRYIIHRTTITTIRPTNYFQKIMEEAGTTQLSLLEQGKFEVEE